MRKIIVLSFAMLISTTQYLFAKTGVDDRAKTLRVEKIVGNGTSLFSNKENWAEVIVQCKSIYNLSFKLSANESLQDMTGLNVENRAVNNIGKKHSAVLVRKTQIGDDTEYVFWFRAGKGYETRNLIVSYLSGDVTRQVFIYLLDLAPKTKDNRWRLYDPQDANDGSVFQEHNVRGQEYFLDCNYVAARQEYILASYCEATESAKRAVEEKISVCDSIITFSNKAEEYISKEMYGEAAALLLKARQLMNNTDRYFAARYFFCTNKVRNTSSILYQNAELLYEDKDYVAAQELYERVAKMGGTEAESAKTKALLCQTMARKRQNKESYLGFELGLGTSPTLGITQANYKEKVGSYFSVHLNTELFELARFQYKMHEVARLDITPIGLTIPVVKGSKVKHGTTIFQGVWFDAGLGATLINRFKVKDDAFEWCKDNKGVAEEHEVTQEMLEEYMQNLSSSKFTDAMKMGVYCAITPEIGFMVKIWQVGLRFTYRQHITPWKKDRFNVLGKSQITIGTGFCF